MFELDSVRNSKEEMELGQKALYEEIVKNGNTVVLTYNQLVDSKVFLSMLSEDKPFQVLKKMFEKGYLKIHTDSRFHTPSEYVQDMLSRASGQAGSTFVFSALPIKDEQRELISVLTHAMRYCDLQSLERRRETHPEEKLDFFIRFIELMITVSSSRKAHSWQPSNAADLYSYISKCVKSLEVWGPDIFDIGLIKRAVEIIETIHKELTEEQLEKRSCWYKKLYVFEDKTAAALAFSLVDLAYNFMQEDSIHTTPHHYQDDFDDFSKDFITRESVYWNQFEQGIHSFKPREDTGYHLADLDWKVAERLWSQVKDKESEDLIPRYEDGIDEQRKMWRGFVYRFIGKQLLWVGLYTVLFVAVDFGVNCLEEMGGVWLGSETLVSAILSILVFGFVSSFLSNALHCPDMIENFRNLKMIRKDYKAYSRVERCAYIRSIDHETESALELRENLA